MGLEFELNENIFSTEAKEVETNQMPEARKSRKTKLVTTVHKRGFKKQEAARQIWEEIGGLPPAGQSIDFISKGESNAGSFYEVLRDEWGEVSGLCVATWIINRYYIDMLLKDVQEGRLKNLVFIISNRMRQLGHHIGNFNFMIAKFQEEPNIKIRVANSHAKTYCMTNGKDYAVIDGSANWSDNPRLENYTITNSKEKYDFRHDWMTQIIQA